MSTIVQDNPAVPFTATARLTGQIQVGRGSIWLGQSVGSVPSGEYEGTQVVATGNGGSALAVYVKRNGKDVGTVVVQLAQVLTAAIKAFEEQEAIS